MKQIDVQAIVEASGSEWANKLPNFSKQIIYKTINKIINAEEMNKFISANSDKRNYELIDELFEYLNFSYSVSHLDKLNIPAEGKVICVANHPLGALDGLAILRAISEVRRDVLIVANDLLLNLENLSDLFLPYNVFSLQAQKENIKRIDKAIQDDCAVVFFPAAVVSRLTPKGVRDGKWSKGALKFALKHKAPILPIFVQAKNSINFYCTSMINKKLAMLLLPNEMFNKRNTEITLKFGNLIPTSSLSAISDINTQNKLLKKHLYKLHKKNVEVFKTEKTIIHPIESKIIAMELANSNLLGTTKDGKSIYSVTFNTAKNTIKEIARLREITFRKVGEGTGEKFDFDKYDKYYHHIVLWDNRTLEIVGSYRIGLCSEILQEYGTTGLYNSEEFRFGDEFLTILPESMEMGRSFIQQKYWRSNALDNLWQGIGLFVRQFPDVKFMFGAVSISDSYTESAKSMIVFYYQKWFGTNDQIVQAKNQYKLSKNQIAEYEAMFNSGDVDADYRILKSTLKEMGYTVPVMFKRYTEICEPGGIKFVNFNTDVNFSNCVDGFIVLDVSKIKKAYKIRYQFIEKELSEMLTIDSDGKLITETEKTGMAI